MLRWLGPPCNASSIHGPGQAARDAVEQAREQVAGAIGAASKEILFVSGATEANATALLSGGARLVTTAGEHPSVLTPAEAAGATVVPLTRSGTVDLDQLESALHGATLCSVIWVNNETGAITDVAEVARLCRAAGVLLHLDASQALGKLPIDVTAMDCDLMTLSAHKAGGPIGVGALWMRRGREVAGLFAGGHQERGRRAGTEPVATLAGFGAAANEVATRLGAQARVGALRDWLEEALVALGGCRTLPATTRRVANTSSLLFAGMSAEAMLMALDVAGVAASAGSACTVGSLEPSHVLLAMGIDEEAASGALRFSLGPETTADQVDFATDALAEILSRLGRTT